MSPLREFAVGALLLAGSGLMLLAAIGLLRFPDVYCRGHAQNKSMTLGISCMLLALWIFLGHERVGAILFLAILAQFATIPIAGHMVALVSFKKNVSRYRQQPVDDHRQGKAGKKSQSPV